MAGASQQATTSTDGLNGGPIDGTDVPVSRLRLGLLRVARRIRQDVTTAALTPSQQSIVVMLDRFGPMSLGELANREAVRPPSVTRSVQALERAGMLSRFGPERGSRRVVVDLTDRGRAAAEEIHERRDAWLSARMAHLSENEIDVLRAAIPVLERLLDE
jgi:DNA-binding MarR family transcriptional regulator